MPVIIFCSYPLFRHMKDKIWSLAFPLLDNQTAPLTLSFSETWSLHPDQGRPLLFTKET